MNDIEEIFTRTLITKQDINGCNYEYYDLHNGYGRIIMRSTRSGSYKDKTIIAPISDIRELLYSQV